MGLVCSRFFTHLPAHTLTRFLKTPSKSFVETNLPLSPTHRRICAQIIAILMKTRNFEEKGGGGCPHALFPLREAQK